jgi:hypothetical protein
VILHDRYTCLRKLERVDRHVKRIQEDVSKLERLHETALVSIGSDIKGVVCLHRRQ